MNVLDAAHAVAHEAPDGAKALGQRMGKSNLCDELNPFCKTAKLGLLDALRMQLLTGDHRILHAEAAELGYMLLPLPSGVSHGVCAVAVASLAQEFADVLAAVAKSEADQRISDTEMAKINREAGELVAALQVLLRHMADRNVAEHARLNAKAC